MLEVNIEQIIADVLAKYPVHESVKNDLIGKMRMDYKKLTSIWVKEENIDDLILEYKKYKNDTQESIIEVQEALSKDSQEAKQRPDLWPTLFEREAWVAYHTAVIEGLEKELKIAEHPPHLINVIKDLICELRSLVNEIRENGLGIIGDQEKGNNEHHNLQSLFYGPQEFQIAIKAAQATELIDENEKWIFTGPKTRAVSLFWLACVAKSLAKVTTAGNVKDAIKEHFGVRLGKNAVNLGIDTKSRENNELYNAIIRHIEAGKTGHGFPGVTAV